MRDKRDLAISRLYVQGVKTYTLAGAFALTEKRVNQILGKPGLVEGIMRSPQHREIPQATKRLSAKEAEAAFENLCLRARNRLVYVHVKTVGEFRKWWKSGDVFARRQHNLLLYGHGINHGAMKSDPPAPTLLSGKDIAKFAVGLGLRPVPPL
jgi:hypothetical protein